MTSQAGRVRCTEPEGENQQWKCRRNENEHTFGSKLATLNNIEIGREVDFVDELFGISMSQLALTCANLR